MTRREDITEYIYENPSSIKQLADFFGVTQKDIEIDLEHIQKTIKRNSTKRLLVKPAECKECLYVFKNRNKIKDPHKCPSCHNERISKQLFKIESAN
ncbi:MAG: transcriptional regulator [Candidatus Thorarchaeota archaeon]